MAEIDGIGANAPEPGTPEFYELLMDYESLSFGVILERAVDDDLSFSREALDSLMFGMQQFIATRMVRYHDDTGEMPRKMKVMVTVEIGGEEEDDGARV